MIIDEALQLSGHCLDALDILCRDVELDPFKKGLPFAGKGVLVAGDPGQTLPIIPGAGRCDIINQLLSRSATWTCFRRFELVENMRIATAVSGAGKEALEKWNRFLMELRKGTMPVTLGTMDMVEIPPEFGIVRPIVDATEEDRARVIEQLIADVYPDFAERCQANDWCVLPSAHSLACTPTALPARVVCSPVRCLVQCACLLPSARA